MTSKILQDLHKRYNLDEALDEFMKNPNNFVK